MVVDHPPVDQVFHALSDATRRDIVATALAEEQSVSALARRYPMSVTAVQKHVNVLVRAGLVEKRRRGREQIVVARVDALRDARAALDRLEELWRARIQRFGEVLADDDESEFRS